MLFADREEAGRRLGARLAHLAGEDVVVLGLPRGGLPVAAGVAAALGAPLDLCLVRKLGVPAQPELGMGAIGEDGVRVVDEGVLRQSGVTADVLARVEERERRELRRRARRYRSGRPPVGVAGRTVVLVDDGVATGSTARAACRTVRARGAARTVLAVPVAPPDWTRRLAGEADELIALATPAGFLAVGQFYADFAQLDDEDAVAFLRPTPIGADEDRGARDDRGASEDHGARDDYGARAEQSASADHDASEDHGARADHGVHADHGARAEHGVRRPDHGARVEHGTRAEHGARVEHGTRAEHGARVERGRSYARGAEDREAEVAVGALRLGGRLSVPENASGVVLFAHGSGSGRHSPRNQFVAAGLHRAGLATLLFDLLTEEEAADRDNVFDTALLAARLTAATRWLRGQRAAEGLPVGYFGASTGAAAALRAAAEPHADIAAVVSRGGRPDLAEAALTAVTAPTLLIVGGADGTVLDLNRRAQSRLTCESRLAVVPGATHLFEEPGALETVTALARDWFTDHMAAAHV
ncbi:phosphoribosyltransferase family protein [Streptomyces sp. NPDC046985]|uniref:phosphoribosyltransferase family protein n=1 Tax=Streptomyces sp. NPDC046985 TaxID=3155377 RepID=UPI0033E1184A